ncbi:MAG: hypothetical protein ACOCVX_04555 [Bacteroidales bacterium]|jgi:hypothetical protein
MKLFIRYLTTFFCVYLLPVMGFAQLNDTSINMFNVNLTYAFHIPAGDISERFGVSSMIGTKVEFKHKSNWIFGLEYGYIFGSNVKDTTILDHLKDETGGIINEYGEYGTVLLTERGFYAGGSIGKIIPVFSPNPNSGIKLQIGAGLLEHHIHIENKDNNVPGVLGDYRKGYDRRTNGLSLKEFVGYHYLDPNGYINFYAGFEFYQAWTYNRRDLNYDTGLPDNEIKHDYLYGFRIGWILPLYQKDPDSFYYF